MSDKNYVSISRIESNAEPAFVSIGITTFDHAIEVKLSLEQFAFLITGRTLMDCDVKIRDLSTSKPPAAGG